MADMPILHGLSMFFVVAFPVAVFEHPLPCRFGLISGQRLSEQIKKASGCRHHVIKGHASRLPVDCNHSGDGTPMALA